MVSVVSEAQKWDEFGKDYDNKVFSLTKYPSVIADILSSIEHGWVLDFGCGSTARLLNELKDCGDIPVGLDHSQEMVYETMRRFDGHVLLDDGRHTILKSNMFSSVVSLNSILPENRSDVLEMFHEIHRVLCPGGRFVAYLPWYDYITKLSQAGLEIEQDSTQFRVHDTTGWQCFFTKKIIADLMRKVGYSKWRLETRTFGSEEQIRDASDLYNFDFSKIPVTELFLVAWK